MWGKRRGVGKARERPIVLDVFSKLNLSVTWGTKSCWCRMIAWCMTHAACSRLSSLARLGSEKHIH